MGHQASTNVEGDGAGAPNPPTEHGGRAAVDMLLAHGDDRRATAQISLNTDLVVRDATGPVPA